MFQASMMAEVLNPEKGHKTETLKDQAVLQRVVTA